MASFMVDIKETRNHSWQGTVTWIDSKKKADFRSAIELIELIDSAVPKDEDNNEFEDAE